MGRFSMTRALTALPQETVTRLRESSGDRIGGFRSGTGFEGTYEFKAHVQTVSAHSVAHMQLLDGGEHVGDAIHIFTKEDLRPSESVGSKQADRVMRLGKFYKVLRQLEWTEQGFRMFVCGSTDVELA